MGWVGRKCHISKPYKSTQPNLPVGAGRGRWVLERSSVCESEGESYVMQIRLGTFVRFWYVALWASHMYPRGIQHVRSAYVIITIHSVCCVCMCLLCEKKTPRLWAVTASLPHPYRIKLWKIFSVFCVWLWQPPVMTVVPLWFISVTGHCIPFVRHWLKHDRSQTILLGFSHGSQWSKCFDCKTWNVLWIGLLVSERYLCVCRYVVKVCFSVVQIIQIITLCGW